MRDVAELLRPQVRAKLAELSGSPPLYPYQRLGTPPANHAQLYSDSESKGRAAMQVEHDGLLYFHAYGEREKDVDEMYQKVRWLDGHTASGTNGVYAVSIKLNTATITDDPDGGMHLQAIYNTQYYRLGGGA